MCDIIYECPLKWLKRPKEIIDFAPAVIGIALRYFMYKTICLRQFYKNLKVFCGQNICDALNLAQEIKGRKNTDRQTDRQTN